MAGAGTRRWRIIIESCVEVRTATGSVEQQWTRACEVWASRRPLKASELTAGNLVLAPTDWAWEIRWVPALANLGAKSRIKLQTGDRLDTVYNISGVLETKPRRELTIYSTTGQNQG